MMGEFRDLFSDWYTWLLLGVVALASANLGFVLWLAFAGVL